MYLFISCCKPEIFDLWSKVPEERIDELRPSSYLIEMDLLIESQLKIPSKTPEL